MRLLFLFVVMVVFLGVGGGTATCAALPVEGTNKRNELLFSQTFAAQFAVVPGAAPGLQQASHIVSGGAGLLRQGRVVFVSGVTAGSSLAYSLRAAGVNEVLLAAASPTPVGGQQAAPAQAQAKPSVSIRLMGTVEFRAELKNMPKWERVLKAETRSPTFDKDLSKLMSPSLYKQWQELLVQAPKMSVMEKAKAVNIFFNRWPYRTDREIYGVEDYWATPEEFMKKSGDCEDYAMAKFFALKKLGVPGESMRILALIDKIRNIGHAILVLYIDDNAYILDNLTGMVLPHDQFKHYVPQYSVNEFYRWAHIVPVKKP